MPPHKPALSHAAAIYQARPELSPAVMAAAAEKCQLPWAHIEELSRYFLSYGVCLPIILAGFDLI